MTVPTGVLAGTVKVKELVGVVPPVVDRKVAGSVVGPCAEIQRADRPEKFAQSHGGRRGLDARPHFFSQEWASRLSCSSLWIVSVCVYICVCGRERGVYVYLPGRGST